MTAPRRLTERQFWQRAAKDCEFGVCTSAWWEFNDGFITAEQRDYIRERMKPLVDRRRKRLKEYHSFFYAFGSRTGRRSYCLKQMQLCQSPARRTRWRREGQ